MSVTRLEIETLKSPNYFDYARKTLEKWASVTTLVKLEKQYLSECLNTLAEAQNNGVEYLKFKFPESKSGLNQVTKVISIIEKELYVNQLQEADNQWNKKASIIESMEQTHETFPLMIILPYLNDFLVTLRKQVYAHFNSMSLNDQKTIMNCIVRGTQFIDTLDTWEPLLLEDPRQIRNLLTSFKYQLSTSADAHPSVELNAWLADLKNQINFNSFLTVIDQIIQDAVTEMKSKEDHDKKDYQVQIVNLANQSQMEKLKEELITLRKDLKSKQTELTTLFYQVNHSVIDLAKTEKNIIDEKTTTLEMLNSMRSAVDQTVSEIERDIQSLVVKATLVSTQINAVLENMNKLKEKMIELQTSDTIHKFVAAINNAGKPPTPDLDTLGKDINIYRETIARFQEINKQLQMLNTPAFDQRLFGHPSVRYHENPFVENANSNEAPAFNRL